MVTDLCEFEAGRIFSEFSGYGTAETALKSILRKQGLGLDASAFLCSSADFNNSCRKLLMANCEDKSSCVFGDITRIVPIKIRKMLFQEVEESFSISRQDVRMALSSIRKNRKKSGNTPGATAEVLFTSANRLKCALGPVNRDFALVGLDDGNGVVKGTVSSAIQKLTKIMNSSSNRPSSVKFIFSRRRSEHCLEC